MRRFLQRVHAALRSGRMERELSEEIGMHLALLAEENRARGMTQQAAWAAARREFGGVEQVREAYRDRRGFPFLNSLQADVRYAGRLFVRNPAFTACAVLTLALGIGANTAIFSLMNALLLRSLPVQDPAQLVEFLNVYPGEPGGNGFSLESYQNYRDHNHVFAGLMGDAGPARFTARAPGSAPEALQGDYVTGSFFPTLGLRPALGRVLGPEDDQPGAAGAAVVSWSYWKNGFNLNPAILGKRLTVGDVPVTIVGVAGTGFSGIQLGTETDFWMPVSLEAAIAHPSRLRAGRMNLRLMARLKPGVSLAQAQAEMNVLYRSTLDEMARNSSDPLVRQFRIEVRPAGAGLSTRLREQFGRPLVLLMALMGLLLLIACLNIAGMLLARGASRQREMAVRVSLGAGRGRLARQVMTESMLLALAGTVAGIAVAYLLTVALVRILMSGRNRVAIQVTPDAHVLLFMAGLALLAGLLFGLAPAAAAFASAPVMALRESGRAGQTRLGRLFGRGLVAGQVAISMVLLGAAGLFVGHLANLQNLDLGFRRDHVLLVTLDPSHSGLGGEKLVRPYKALLRRFEAIPGVRSATLSAVTPISGAAGLSYADVEGHPEAPGERRYVSLNSVAPKYFETFGTPLLAGRDFTAADEGGPRVAIVNLAMARYYFGDASPIGKHVTLEARGGVENRTYEIVGVAGDARYAEILEPTPRTFYSDALQGHPYSQFALRTSITPTAVAGEVRRAVRELLGSMPVLKLTTLEDQVNASIVPERLIALLAGWFGILGAALVAIGIYGLLTYTVSRRLNEIGLRMAMGARRSEVTWMVVRDALSTIGAGLAAGTPVAWWGMRLAGRLLRDLQPGTLSPIAFGAFTLLAVGLTAAYLPAWRAARVDPVQALRCE